MGWWSPLVSLEHAHDWINYMCWPLFLCLTSLSAVVQLRPCPFLFSDNQQSQQQALFVKVHKISLLHDWWYIVEQVLCGVQIWPIAYTWQIDVTQYLYCIRVDWNKCSHAFNWIRVPTLFEAMSLIGPVSFTMRKPRMIITSVSPSDKLLCRLYGLYDWLYGRWE